MIGLSRPSITDEDITNVVTVLKSGRLSLGPCTKEFEKAFADMIGTSYACAVNSGTSGLHLAVRALGITHGDEIIVSPFSFIASANCALYEGATPVFVDVEDDTFNMDPRKIEEKITPRTKAILVAHIFGRSCDMTPILELAHKYNLHIIEDACESILGTYHGKNVGTFGAISVFAFYPNKQMTTGEGGMVVTNNKELYELCSSMRNQGRSDDMRWLTHDKLGYNYRIDEMSAALGLSQLRRVPEFIRLRKKIASRYNALLKGVPGIRLCVERPELENSWFVYSIRVHAQIRDTLIQKLLSRGIDCKAYFDPCIHLQPFYIREFGFKEGEFPVAERLSKETVILPFYTDMTEDDIVTVVNAVKESMEEL